MKLAKFTVLLIVIMALMSWIRQDQSLGPLPTCLPLLHGQKLSANYEIAGIVCFFIILAKIARLQRNDRDEDQP